MFNIRKCSRYLLIEFNADVTLDGVFKAIEETMSHSDYKEFNDIYVFGDQPVFIGFDQLDDIVKVVEVAYPADATRNKTALVVSSGFNAAIAQMWRQFAARLPYEVEVFSDFKAAEEWVLADERN